jgi:hypothetical protein
MSIVARIAYEKLNSHNSSVLTQANNLLRWLPHPSDKEHLYPFVECATLADDIKYTGGGWQSDWHFVDLPWFDQGGDIDKYPEFK